MTKRIITDSNGRKHITNEPKLHKPQRTWQGLTDEEYSQLHDGLYQQGKSLGWVVDQIEEKLKGKNHD